MFRFVFAPFVWLFFFLLDLFGFIPEIPQQPNSPDDKSVG